MKQMILTLLICLLLSCNYFIDPFRADDDNASEFGTTTSVTTTTTPYVRI